MDVEALVRSHGGVMHRLTLRDFGYSAYRLRKAVVEGRLRRVGRDRLSVLDCSESIEAAARVGARLSCVSAAAHFGLWVHRTDQTIHVAAAHGFSLKRPGELPAGPPEFVVHRARTPVAVARGVPLDPLLNALVHVAACQPLELAVAIFDSALNKRIVAVGALREMRRWQPRRFREVVALCDTGADAGNESVLRVRLLRSGVPVRIQVVLDGHPVDALIGERLVIQTDGYFFHADPVRRGRDLRQDASLRTQGFTVQRFSALQVLNDWPFVDETIRAAIAQGAHRWPITRPLSWARAV